MASPKSLRWRDWSDSGLEHVRLREGVDYIEAQSTVIAATGFAALYSVKLGRNWQVIQVRASVIGSDREKIELRRTAPGEWFGYDDEPILSLRPATDVDLSITPFTNTLPIKRLNLPIGQSPEVTAAYVSFPELKVMPDCSDTLVFPGVCTDIKRLSAVL